MHVMESRNVKFCAYLRYRKIHPDNVEIFAKGRAIYIYKMSQEDWRKLKIEFDKSEFVEYGNCMDAIKDLAY